jgi:predicted phosphoadenosine phosphosulfate sulfurtransferase
MANSMQAIRAVDEHLDYFKSTGNYSEGLSWAMSLPSFSQRMGIGRLTNDWAEEDPAAAADWINQLPQGEARDQTTAYLIDVIQGDSPSIAFQWAQSISNEEARLQEVLKVYDSWKRINPEEAQNAMDSMTSSK